MARKSDMTPAQQAARQKEKREKFEELALKRMRAAVKKIRGVANLSNTANYSYTPAQAEKIVKALASEVDGVQRAFAGKVTTEEVFSF